VNPNEADLLFRTTLHEIAPDADLDSLGPRDDLRDTLALDSLDFLQIVESLSTRTGHRIDEDDYPRLATMAGAVEYLSAAS
jgi:acyl carrier protein